MNFKLPKIYDAGGDLSSQWYVYYFFRHPETGKMQRFKKLISRSLLTKQARYTSGMEIKADLRKRLLAGFDPFVNNQLHGTNIIEALEYVRRYKIATLAKRSGSTYSSIIKIFIEWVKKQGYAARTVDALTQQVAERYVDNMIMYENLSNRTINNRIGFLRTVCAFMVKKGMLAVNPFSFTEYLPEREPTITAYTKAELSLIKETLPVEHYQLYVVSQLIFYCFLRPAELVRLQFRDVFREHGIIAIPGSKSKNGKSEVIVMPDAMLKNLKEWVTDKPSGWYLFSNGRSLTPGTRQIAPTRIAEAWRDYAKRHGIEKNIYDMKHTGNGFAFDAGLSARDIQLQNRHHSLDQTQQYLNRFRRKAGDDFKRKFAGY